MTGVIEELLWNEKQAAKALNVSARTLFGMRQRGEIPYVPRGKSIRYRPEDVRAWINANIRTQQGTIDGQ